MIAHITVSKFMAVVPPEVTVGRESSDGEDHTCIGRPSLKPAAEPKSRGTMPNVRLSRNMGTSSQHALMLLRAKKGATAPSRLGPKLAAAGGKKRPGAATPPRPSRCSANALIGKAQLKSDGGLFFRLGQNRS